MKCYIAKHYITSTALALLSWTIIFWGCILQWQGYFTLNVFALKCLRRYALKNVILDWTPIIRFHTVPPLREDTHMYLLSSLIFRLLIMFLTNSESKAVALKKNGDEMHVERAESLTATSCCTLTAELSFNFYFIQVSSTHTHTHTRTPPHPHVKTVKF